MESADLDMCSLQAFRHFSTFRFNSDMSSESRQEQQDESEPDIQPDSNQETPELRSGPLRLVVIVSRIRWLHNRRFSLQNKQQFTKKAEQHSGSSTEELTSDGDDTLRELEAIQAELEELQAKREELEEQERSSKLKVNGGHQGGTTLYKDETLTHEPTSEKTGGAAERPTVVVVPVDSLRQVAEITKCPSCQEVVVTETHSTVSEAMWLSCFLCSMIGCVAGCCLIPFHMKSLRNVHHQCPWCQEHIHTYNPL